MIDSVVGVGILVCLYLLCVCVEDVVVWLVVVVYDVGSGVFVGLYVLFVEDNGEVVVGMEVLLLLFGYCVIYVLIVDDVLCLIEGVVVNDVFDFVILDIYMLGCLNGIDFVEVIEKWLGKLFVIFVMGYVEEFDCMCIVNVCVLLKLFDIVLFDEILFGICEVCDVCYVGV